MPFCYNMEDRRSKRQRHDQPTTKTFASMAHSLNNRQHISARCCLDDDLLCIAILSCNFGEPLQYQLQFKHANQPSLKLLPQQRKQWKLASHAYADDTARPLIEDFNARNVCQQHATLIQLIAPVCRAALGSRLSCKIVIASLSKAIILGG